MCKLNLSPRRQSLLTRPIVQTCCQAEAAGLGGQAPVAPGLLRVSASDRGHGTAAGVTGRIQSWTGSLGTNTEHAHNPFSQDIGTGDGSQLLELSVPLSVCPALS